VTVSVVPAHEAADTHRPPINIRMRME
jgi:hypothetical protein